MSELTHSIEPHARFQAVASRLPACDHCPYGPDNCRATKLVVGILRRAAQSEPNPDAYVEDRHGRRQK